MIIYTYGTNTIDTYDFPHSEVVVALNAAKGFQALGYETVALWGGPSCTIEGIKHEHAQQAEPGPDDLLFLFHPLTACSVIQNPAFSKLLNAGRHWLFTNGFYSFHMCKVWKQLYTRVFTEGEGHVQTLRDAMPGVPVEYLMLGCSHDLDIQSLEDPYPKDGNRYLFYAGRISQLDKFRWLLDELPSNYRILCASQQILNKATGTELNISNDDRVKAHYENIHGSGIHLVGEDVAERYLSEHINSNRFEYIGCLPFGSFHNYHHFAFASLDFGYQNLPPTISCKVMDAMRAGGRVIADGLGRSFEFITQYTSGKTVHFGDFRAMVQILESWETETSDFREKQGLAFRDGESWNARIKSIEKYL